MAIPAKPTTYTIDTGAAYYPGYLWVFDEDAPGTTFPNRGSAGTAALANTGFDRSVDGTHGAIWSSVRENSDYAQIDSNLGITTGFTIVGFCRIGTPPTGTSNAGPTLFGFQDLNVANLHTYLTTADAEATNPGSLRAYTDESGTVTANSYSTTNITGSYEMFVFQAGITTGNQYIRYANGTLTSVGAPLSSTLGSAIDRFSIAARRDSSPSEYATADWLAVAVYPNTLLNDTQLDAIYADPWGQIGLSTSTTLYPVMQPLYYGATLLANKTGIEYVITTGGSLNVDELASGSNATTDGSGNVVFPYTSFSGGAAVADDPCIVHLYWEEGSSPVVDRSLIVKTTLAAA